MGMLITLFLIPVGWAGAFVAFLLFRALRRRQAVSRQPFRAPARRPRRHGRRLHGRRLREPGAARAASAIGSSVIWSLIDRLPIDPMPDYPITDHESLHRGRRQRDADAVSRRHELAVHHRAAERDRLSTSVSRRSSATTSASSRGVLEGALAWADLIVVTGGLGPTEDDITRDAVARVLGVPLDVDEADRRAHPRAVRAPRPDDARDQPAAGDGAARRDGARRTRTARRPGLWLERGGRAIVLLPGPPREMKPMLEAVIARAARAARRAAPACSGAC